MTQMKQVYKCSICGNIVEILNVGAGDLVCCQKPMGLLIENSTDAAQEKHVPVLKRTEDGFEVQVGSTVHPMEDKHYIQWIELIADGLVYRKELKPGDEPKAKFCVDGAKVKAREYCNLHGLWKGEL